MTRCPNHSPTISAASRLSVALTVGLIAGVLVLAGCPWRSAVPPGATDRPVSRPRLNPAQAARVVQQHNLAVGSLGVADYEDAVSQWEELSLSLPDEPAVAANLTVAYLLRLRSAEFVHRGENGEFAALVPAAQQAVQRLLAVAGEDANSHLLAAKLARTAGDDPGMWQALDRAAALAPDDPIVWFERFQTARVASDDAGAARGAAAIRRTHALVPDNLFVLVQLIWQQAADHDLAIGDSLIRLRQLAEPIVGDSPRFRKQDLSALFDQAAEATAVARSSTDPTHWKTLTTVSRRIGNVLLAETPTRIDFRRLDRQNERDLAELEFVRPRLSDAFYASTPEIVRDLGPPISVRFQAAPEPDQLPPLPGVRAVELLDFDLDGRLDVVAMRSQAIEVYGRSEGNSSWQRIATFHSSSELRGLVAADLDRDAFLRGPAAASRGFHPGDVDLIAFGPAGVQILENCLDEASGQRSLKEVAQDPALGRLADVSAAGLADWDHDGDLDLIVSTAAGVSLWLNDGRFAFRDVSDRSVLPGAELRFGSIVSADWNRDLGIDVLLAGPAPGAAGWLENRRHGRLVWRPFPAGSALAAGAADLGLTDPGGNGMWDLLTAGPNGLALNAISPADPLFRTQVVDRGNVTGLRLWDYDNDGYQDILTWGDSGLAFWQGTSDGRFRAVSLLESGPLGDAQDCAVGDVDADGDEDLFVVTPDRATWYVNQGGNQNHWLDVVLEPAANPEQFPDLRINLNGWGSLVELRIGPVCQSRVVTWGPVHFGLGASLQADLVQVRWTNGLICTRREPPARQRLRIEQVLKGM
jgi:hypothetical protein